MPSIRIGGYLADLPKLYKTKWPESDELREVKIDLNTWVGLSLGATHWYVLIEEELNYIWHEKDQVWQECRDHPDELKGLKIEDRNSFTNKKDAQSWIRRMYKKHFNDGKHKARFVSYDEDDLEWFYRQGKEDGVMPEQELK